MTGPSSRVPVLLVLVWLAGLLVATSVGLLAVRLVAAQVGDPAVAPLSAVAAASAAASASPVPSPSPPPSTDPQSPLPTARPSAVAAATRTFATAAGTLGVQCTGTALRLLYATPAQGYSLDERSVSGSEAEVRFEGGVTRVRIRLSCSTRAPRLVEQRTDPDDAGDDQDDDAEDDD